MVNNVVLDLRVQQSDSVLCVCIYTYIYLYTHTYESILFQILSPVRLLQYIEQSSQYYTAYPCWLSILNIAARTCQSQTTQMPLAAAAAAKSLQSCPTLCDPIDSSPPGSPVHGILQARTLQWVAISFSNA